MKTCDPPMLLDVEYEDYVIERVERQPGGYEVAFKGGWMVWVEDRGIEPKPGDDMRLYGRGIGYTIRGIAINGNVVRYETVEESQARHRAEIERSNAEERARFEQNRAAIEQRIAALPGVFQQRIARFRANNPDFEWQYLDYELFCCEQAVVIATALGSPIAIRAFHNQESWDEQRGIVAGLSAQHSGNTFDVACRLAVHYLESPELVVNGRGALTVLAGAEDYGDVPRPTPDSHDGR